MTMPGRRPNTATCSPPSCGCWAPTTRATLVTRNRIAIAMAALGDHDGALAEYRDVLDGRAAGAGPRPAGHAGHPA